jgi:colanic acid biosynthesis glycosyl transferase WcaI
VSRILIWSPNYAPELTGIPPLMTEAAEWLSNRGHHVEVVTAVPNYPERRIAPEYDGVLWRSEHRGPVRIHRSWLRVRPGESFADKALYELSFSTFSLPSVVRHVRGMDVLVCVVPTLTAAVYATAVARVAGARLVLWVQDLVLAAALSLDALGDRAKKMLRAAQGAERFVAGSADLVVVCSPGFRDYFEEIGVERSHVEVVLNWVDLDRIEPAPARSNGVPRFLYAGNLGYTQGFETLVEAARLVGPAAEVEIAGGGNAAAQVAALTQNLPNVTLRPPVPEQEFPQLLAGADVHIVLQRRVAAGANLPSKIATYLASGRPIVASIDRSTPAAELLLRSGGAILVEPESPAELAAAMLHLGSEPSLRAELGERGRHFAEQTLGREAALGRLEAAILG